MSSDVSTLAGTIAVAMTADHLQYYEAGAKEVRGMYLPRIHRAWGHAAYRGWARLLLDRCRDLIHHGGRTTSYPTATKMPSRKAMRTTNTNTPKVRMVTVLVRHQR